MHKLFKRFKWFQYFFLKSSRDENLVWHNYVVAKSTGIDRAFVAYSISGNFAWMEHQKILSSAASNNLIIIAP